MRLLIVVFAALALSVCAINLPPPVISQHLPNPANDDLNVEFVGQTTVTRFYDYNANGTLDLTGYWGLALDSIVEVDKNGHALTNALTGLSQVSWGGYVVGQVTVAGKKNIVWQCVNYTNTFDVGTQKTNVLIFNNYFLNDTTFEYEGVTLKQKANTLLIGIQITNWPFTLATNQLSLTFLVNNTHPMPSSKNNVKSSGRALTYTGGANMGYFYLPSVAFVDNNETASNTVKWMMMNDGASAMFTLPSFQQHVTYLPYFAVGKPPSSSSHSKTKDIAIGVAVAVGVCVIAMIILAVVIFFMRPRHGYQQV